MQRQPASEAIQDGVAFLYGLERTPDIYARLMGVLDDFRAQPHSPPAGDGSLSERDSILITYGDMVSEPGVPPLATLGDFLSGHLGGAISTIHLLPFFPYSSDDGFSVIGYRQVDPQLGTWEDIEQVGQHFRLMFDGVINHISAQSDWFQGFLRDDPAYRDWFITVEGNPDLSRVVRPRALPLLTHFATPSGEKVVWTTFSADQIDLNYRNPDVLLEIIDTLLYYVAQGAEFIRLDAIAYLWKEIGTPCIHLPQTHRIIQLIRAALDEVAPYVKLITETNVPHMENVSYWGDGSNEAQLVYNFALPPLTLHTFRTGDASLLSEWAASLSPPTGRVTFFNFLASHDGIGLNPARGILADADIEALVEGTLARKGYVSHKQNPDGSQSPYELNINYLDALGDPVGDEPLQAQIDRFMAAQAIMLALVGVPGIYFHSLFGSRGWPEGVEITGRTRAINRHKPHRATLEGELNEDGSLRRQIFDRTVRLLRARAASPAFHPHGGQDVLDCGAAIFALRRYSPDGRQAMIGLHNVSDRPRQTQLPETGARLTDLLTGQTWEHTRSFDLEPYQVRWLQVDKPS